MEAGRTVWSVRILMFEKVWKSYLQGLWPSLNNKFAVIATNYSTNLRLKIAATFLVSLIMSSGRGCRWKPDVKIKGSRHLKRWVLAKVKTKKIGIV